MLDRKYETYSYFSAADVVLINDKICTMIRQTHYTVHRNQNHQLQSNAP